jgi:hypothetical protein
LCYGREARGRTISTAHGETLGHKVSHAADQTPRDLAAPARADDDEPRVLLVGYVGEHERGVATADALVHVQTAHA